MTDKPFDAVAFMRRRREEIDREDERLSWNEKRVRTMKSLEGDPVWERIKERLVTAGDSAASVARIDSNRG